MSVEDALPEGVFINCPFDAPYAPTFEAIRFAIHDLGLRPRSALELQDSAEPRIERLFSIIEECRYGIHDLSRTELDPLHGLPRFNMPFELGVFLGARRFGAGTQRDKRALILDVERYRYQRFVSDLAGMDIQAHGGDVQTAMRRVRDWLGNVSRRKLTGADRLIEAHERFTERRSLLAERLEIDAGETPYADFDRLVLAFLLDPPEPSA